MRFFTRISNWLDQVALKHGLVPAFGLAAFLEATFIPLVIDLFMLSFLMTGKVKLWKLITVGAAASIIGTSLFWIAGALVGDPLLATAISTFSIPEQTVVNVTTDFQENWILATLFALLTAIPDFLVALLAATQGIGFLPFLAVISISLLIRFSILGAIVWIVAKLLKKTGKTAQRFVTGLSFIASLAIALIGIVLVFF